MVAEGCGAESTIRLRVTSSVGRSEVMGENMYEVEKGLGFNIYRQDRGFAVFEIFDNDRRETPFWSKNSVEAADGTKVISYRPMDLDQTIGIGTVAELRRHLSGVEHSLYYAQRLYYILVRSGCPETGFKFSPVNLIIKDPWDEGAGDLSEFNTFVETLEPQVVGGEHLTIDARRRAVKRAAREARGNTCEVPELLRITGLIHVKPNDVDVNMYKELWEEYHGN